MKALCDVRERNIKGLKSGGDQWIQEKLLETSREFTERLEKLIIVRDHA